MLVTSRQLRAKANQDICSQPIPCLRSQYDADRGDIDACTDLDRDQPYFSVERNDDGAEDDKDDDAYLEGVREVACPYSEVDETDRAVSAGK